MSQKFNHADSYDAAIKRATDEARKMQIANSKAKPAAAISQNAEIARLTEMVNYLSAQVEARKAAPPQSQHVAPSRRHSDADQERLDRMIVDGKTEPNVSMVAGVKQVFGVTKRGRK